ncbi:hypothetical protein BKA56DRAFT_213306 [Ilyonectria sp. MPI-CAGE-AT-0026]|nr:hypothetical protein BKA56DRAFT_213306 [Ilyonectria sp. MPI-CAGE-AT-0026]
MWIKRFQALLLSDTCSGSDQHASRAKLKTFAYTAPILMERQDEGVAATYQHLRAGLDHIMEWTVANFHDFQLTEHAKAPLELAMDALVFDKILSTDLVGPPKQWITTDAIGSIVKAMLQDGLQNGTLSWDVLIMKTLSLLLQCILSAKTGDLRESYDYEEYECLYWKDIHVQMVTKNGKRVLIGTIPCE